MFIRRNLRHLFFIGLLIGIGYFVGLASVALLYFENDNIGVVWVRMVNFLRPTGWPFLIVIVVIGPFFLKWISKASSFLRKYTRCWLAGILITFFMNLVYFYQQVFPDFQVPWNDGELCLIFLQYSFVGLLYSLPGLLLICLLPSLYLVQFGDQIAASE